MRRSRCVDKGLEGEEIQVAKRGVMRHVTFWEGVLVQTFWRGEVGGVKSGVDGGGMVGDG